ncbi:uncharacterized protein LOC116253528 [Nymphaea colorata]|uniref:uncharacterized protein LOC116253528 n=1 Tax=Nymphaea colorata TaxID=210225 RepID=UPI00129E5411|nr:uncharacterized protein LOC116253528 [Nymphaea colorata]
MVFLILWDMHYLRDPGVPLPLFPSDSMATTSFHVWWSGCLLKFWANGNLKKKTAESQSVCSFSITSSKRKRMGFRIGPTRWVQSIKEVANGADPTANSSEVVCAAK